MGTKQPKYKLNDMVYLIINHRAVKSQITGVTFKDPDIVISNNTTIDYYYCLEARELPKNRDWFLEEYLYPTKQELIESLNETHIMGKCPYYKLWVRSGQGKK